MSRASMKAEPTMPKMFLVPLATRVSVKASLEVISVGLVLHSGSVYKQFDVEKQARGVKL